MTAASVRDDITPLAGHGLLYANTRQVQCRCYQWFTKASFNGHLADVAWMHVEPLLADLRADNDKLRDEHQAWRAAVAWQKRGLAAEAKVERVEALEPYWSGDRLVYSADKVAAALRGDDGDTCACGAARPAPARPSEPLDAAPALRGDDAATDTECCTDAARDAVAGLEAEIAALADQHHRVPNYKLRDLLGRPHA